MRSELTLSVAAVFLSLVGLTNTGQEVFFSRALADEKPVSKRDRSWIEKRVEEWQPSREERAFDEIGWAKNLREAERLAKEHGRPIFLFTYSGASMACYRC